MKLFRLGLLAVAAAGITVIAQENTEFADWMKSCNQAQGVLRKLDQKTGPQATRSAERIGVVYENMIGFWRQRNASDAVKWSEEGKSAAAELASAATANDAEKAQAAFGKIGGTCKSCHDVHRERVGEGQYKIK